MSARTRYWAALVPTLVVFGCGASSKHTSGDQSDTVAGSSGSDQAGSKAKGTGGSQQVATSTGGKGSAGAAGSRSGGQGGRAGSGRAGQSAGGSGMGTGGDMRPDTVPTRFVPGDCNLDQPAFCETFEKPNPGGRGGDLDEALFGYARWGHVLTTVFDRVTSESNYENQNLYGAPVKFCGKTFTGIDDPDDAKFCDGVDGGGFASTQFNEVLSDGGGFALNEMRIRQPFDFTDRTGTIVFDVDAKTNKDFDGHGWWLELWISEDPAPIPYHGAPTVASFPRSAVGFQIVPGAQECFKEGLNQVSRVIVAKDYDVIRDEQFGNTCFKTADGKLNRFKVMISKSKAEFWVSDADAPGQLRMISSIDLALTFSFGYVHLQHSQYNSGKAHASPGQTFRWDNVGFDGPSYPTPRAYDVPDDLSDVLQSNKVVGKQVGYMLDQQNPKSFTLSGVDKTNATRATFNFDFNAKGGEQFKYRFNAHDWHTWTVPMVLGTETQMRSFSLEVPLTEIAAGDNTLEAQNVNASFLPFIGNIDLTIDVSK